MKNNWQEFKKKLETHNISKLYHFTDRSNIESIIRNGGLYSWADCEDRNIVISKPGGSDQSRFLDKKYSLHHYARVSFTPEHPMMYVAMSDGRISNPVILEIDPSVIYLKDTKFSDRNAAKDGAKVGESLNDFKSIHFESVKARNHFDLDTDEQMYYQAEVLVKNHIPLKYILNIGNFGYSLPNNVQSLQCKEAYTAQITRTTPTAFIFLIDQSISMGNTTTLNGETMTKSEAVARIINRQIEELVLRCIKYDDVRHYYDIAVIGYGDNAYSAWNGKLSGRDFVSPEELKLNPFKEIVVREQTRTRKGVSVKEVKKVQWMEACEDGSCTHMHKAFAKAKRLLEEWMEKYHDKDCYPPTIINITDGEFNGVSVDRMLQLANEIKSMHTNDGNVILFNIHISSNNEGEVIFPIDKSELDKDKYGQVLYDMSSLLPVRYNNDISSIRQDSEDSRHVAMAVNSDMSTLIQLMDIGTPTNISNSK